MATPLYQISSGLFKAAKPIPSFDASPAPSGADGSPAKAEESSNQPVARSKDQEAGSKKQGPPALKGQI
jgi:hypothetical protein